MPCFNIVAETNENTVVTAYEPVAKRPEIDQSEGERERNEQHRAIWAIADEK